MLSWLLRDSTVYVLQITDHVSMTPFILAFGSGHLVVGVLLYMLIEIPFFHSVLPLWDSVDYCDVWHCFILLMCGVWLLAAAVRVVPTFGRPLSSVSCVASVISTRSSVIIGFGIFCQFLLQPQFSEVLADAMSPNWRTFEILTCPWPYRFRFFGFPGGAQRWSEDEVAD